MLNPTELALGEKYSYCSAFKINSRPYKAPEEAHAVLRTLVGLLLNVKHCPLMLDLMIKLSAHY